MPEYFIALVKQFGNLTSSEEAERVAKDISSCLYMTLTDDQNKLFLAYTPQYLHIKPNIFRETIKRTKREYRHRAFLDRLSMLEGLTDENEVNNRVKAYFEAVAVVTGERQYQNLLSILPKNILAIL